jgi:hypothetical protein
VGPAKIQNVRLFDKVSQDGRSISSSQHDTKRCETGDKGVYMATDDPTLTLGW